MKSAICLIVRNEVREVAEWIAFHGQLGFDTQIIFDNRSDDGTDAVIKAAAKRWDVRYHYWPNSSQKSQVMAYQAACDAYKLEFDWMAFVDSDEYLIPTDDIPINDFLARFERWSGIAVNWAVYGSNGHTEIPQGLTIENYTRRAPADFFPARHVKSIIRPRFAERPLNPHYFDIRPALDGGFCDANGNYMLWWLAPEHGGVLRGVGRAEPDYTACRVNHYFTRSRAHWDLKLKRGYPSDVAIRKMEEFGEYDRNEVNDPIALRYANDVRAGAEEIRALLR